MFFLSFVAGLALLLGGAELLVRGGGRIALALRVPIIVVALTIVAFGTSMPEISVSVTAAVKGSGDMALGNVIGSNIANIALVLGAATVIMPIHVGRELMRREVPTLVLMQVSLPLMLLDGLLGRVDGLILLVMGLVYTLVLLRDALAGRASPDTDEVEEGGDYLTNIALLVLGVALLLAGGQFFVDGASGIARALGLDERVIGLTVVALGTSAPELVTGTMAAYRGENDMAVGNSLGSNILNVALALAVSAMVQPIPLHQSGTWVDLGVAFLVTVLLIPMILRGRVISRVEGGLLITLYVVYVVGLGAFGGGS
ncbi:MAG: calcium/sodium antiporter [Alphaproteobacteria bacterium]|nr:calcium/sodium antiporter [Alphaproteobacteria bacterium]